MQTAQATKLTDLAADRAPEAGTALEDRSSGVVIQLDAHRRKRTADKATGRESSTEAGGQSAARLGDFIGSLLARLPRPNRRHHTADERRPLVLKIDGKKYKTANWSLGGFRIDGFHNPSKPRNEISGTIGAIGSVGPGKFVAEVTRVCENGQIGMRLLEVSPATFLAMTELRAC